MAGLLRAIAGLCATSMVVYALENTVGSGAGGRGPVGEPRRGVRVAGDDYALPLLMAAAGVAPPKWSSGVTPRQAASRNDSDPIIQPRTDTSITFSIENGKVSTVITSPNYPRRYPNNYEHTWTITTSIPGSVLRVVCLDFHIRCWGGDYLQFTDRSNGDKSERLCGRRSRFFIEVKESLGITFQTDWKRNAKGFKCIVRAVASPSVTTSTSTSTTTSPSVTTSTSTSTTASPSTTSTSTSTTASPSTTSTSTSTTTPTPRCECGQVNRETRIVGGVETEVNEYPWQVGLVRKRENVPFCGGSLINKEWILTAAHCVNRMTTSRVEVLIGEHNLQTTDDSTDRIGISQTIPHPEYNSNTTDNDMALLRLEKPVNLTPKFEPVCMPKKNTLYENVDAIVTGWGALEYGGKQPETLMEVTVPTMTNSKCNTLYSGRITDNMICAGLDQGGKDSCQGDSGGPLVTSNGKAMELIGVVSWGFGCADKKFPGVYARVGNYLDWINEHAKKVYNCSSN